MRLLFTTQSETLPLFEALRAQLEPALGLERTGFTIADSLAYRRWARGEPGFEQRGHLLLKEWEVTRRVDGEPDMALLARYESEIGGRPGLFGALVADRRLFMGPDCTYSQDYRRRYTDRELMCILQSALQAMERMFDELRPDVLVGFICVTMLEYLAFLFARARGVRVLNLRPTRVADLVTFGATLNDPSPELAAACAISVARDGAAWQAATAHTRRVRDHHGRYEGVVPPSQKPALKVNAARRGFSSTLTQVVRNYTDYASSEAARDNHVANPLRALFFAAVVNPARARRAARVLAGAYRMPGDMREVRYAFFPLHTEPEVSLLVYGRPHVNQLEVVRAIAMSLPADMFLVVKEHPWMVGKRSLGSYRKLLNIPKVVLANPGTEARAWIVGAKLVTVITSSVALEAAILGKPVITLGDCPYNLLPPWMLRYCGGFRELPRIIRELLEAYRRDDEALHTYVAAVFDTSVSINLYSVLLQKKGVHAERPAAYAEEIAKLAAHVLQILARPVPVRAEGAAAW